MVLDTLFVQLCAIIAEIFQNHRFYINGGTKLPTNMPWTHVVTPPLTHKTWVWLSYLFSYLQYIFFSNGDTNLYKIDRPYVGHLADLLK